jgi:O-antigen ligase
MTLQQAPATATATATANSVCDGFWARTVSIAIVAWPTLTGYLVLRQGLAPAPLEVLSTLIVALLLFVGGVVANRGLTLDVMTRWQVALVMIVALAFVISSVHSALKPRDAVALGLIDATLAAGAVGAFLLLRAGGEVMIRRMLLGVILSGLTYIVFYAVHFDAMVARADGNATLSFLPFGNVRRLTNVLAPTAAIAIVFWAVSGPRDRWLGYFCGIAATALITFLIWSGGRAPVAATVVTLVGLSFWARGELRRRLMGRVAFSYAAGTILSVILPRPDSGSLFLWGRVLLDEKTATFDGFTSRRAWLWEETLKVIPDHLWFGHGYRQWMLHREEFLLHGSAHNFPLQILFDFGLIGGGAALILAFGAWLGHLRLLDSRRPLHLIAVTGLSVMMVQCFVDGIFSVRPSLQLVLLCFAVSAAALHVSHSRSSSP